MPVKAGPIRHLLLLAIVVFQSCINANDFPGINSPTVQLTSSSDQNAQHGRSLSAARVMATNNGSDERGFNLGASTVTKFEGLTTAAIEKLKTLVASAKTKVSSNNQLAIDQRFNLFKVNKVNSNLLESAEFGKWHNFVKKAYKKKEGEAAMVRTLTKHYGDEELAKLLSKASTSNIIAERLEGAQFSKWLVEERSVGNVFNLLKLDEVGENLFRSPQLSSWVKYANKFQSNPEETMFLALKAHFDDQTLARMLIAAKDDTSIHSDIVIKLENVELELWLSRGKTSDDIFKFLNLNDDAGNLLKNPAFNTWFSFVTKAEKEKPYDVVLAKLLSRYDEESLTKLILTARDDSKTRLIAEKLEVVLQNKLNNGRKTAEDAFKLLKLEKEGESIFTSPMWSSWNSYLQKVSKDDPDELMYLILKSQFGEEKLKTMIGKAKENFRTKSIADKLQEEIWRSEGKSADDIFKLLKLDEKKEKFFEDPTLSTWISYVTKLEKFKVKPNEFVIITYLEKKFGEVKLAHILAMEKKQNHVATKNEVITDLQGMQFKRWMTEAGVNPKRLDIMLLLQDTSKKVMPANVQLLMDFHDFYKANVGSPFYMST